MTQCNFRVGQKVVCIDDKSRGRSHPEAIVIGGMDGLKEGEIYTIRAVFFDVGWGEVSLHLCEIVRSPSRFRGERYEGGFDPTRFKAVVERKTDISIFKALLTPSKEKVETAS